MARAGSSYTVNRTCTEGALKSLRFRDRDRCTLRQVYQRCTIGVPMVDQRVYRRTLEPRVLGAQSTVNVHRVWAGPRYFAPCPR